eukprot:scaffold19829_cov47-Prasinocladus_malaysianus.AAC.1
MSAVVRGCTASTSCPVAGIERAAVVFCPVRTITAATAAASVRRRRAAVGIRRLGLATLALGLGLGLFFRRPCWSLASSSLTFRLV